MFYAIDFDSLSVESKSEDKEELQNYVDENDLSMAIAIISSQEELVLEFTLKEMQILFSNLLKISKRKTRDFEDEEDAASFVLNELNYCQEDFPKYTKTLGKKLVKQANKPDPVDNSKIDKPIQSKPAKIKIKAKELIGMVFCNTGKVPREGTACRIMTDLIEENLGEATYDELVETFVENYKPKNSAKVVDDKLGAVYVREAFVNGFIEEGL
jgi:hypothetical protein